MMSHNCTGMRTSVKTFILLCLPVCCLIIWGSCQQMESALRLKSVSIQPARSRITHKIKKGVVAVDVSTEYFNPSLTCLMRAEPALWYDLNSGLYVEDEHGTRYGKTYQPQEPKVDLNFMNASHSYGVIFSTVNNDPYTWRFEVPVNQIPKSAGKLTLKTVLLSGTMDSPSRLPISVVIRP